ncbi:unnamed protein product, partial [Urochloa humidicola]
CAARPRRRGESKPEREEEGTRPENRRRPRASRRRRRPRGQEVGAGPAPRCRSAVATDAEDREADAADRKHRAAAAGRGKKEPELSQYRDVGASAAAVNEAEPRAQPARPQPDTASPLRRTELPVRAPNGSPEDPDYFDDVDYAEEDKDNTPVCELQVRIWSSSPNVLDGLCCFAQGCLW